MGYLGVAARISVVVAMAAAFVYIIVDNSDPVVSNYEIHQGILEVQKEVTELQKEVRELDESQKRLEEMIDMYIQGRFKSA